MASHIHFEPLSGAQLQPFIPQIARLRIEVFKAFPYLYDGSHEYEEAYLSTFATAKDALAIAAFENDTLIGCATGSAMDEHHQAFAHPLIAHGIDIRSVFYFAESVLLEPFRGHGIGHRFFDLREAWAKSRGYEAISFCTVIRANDHPLRSSSAADLTGFWQNRGYRPVPDAIARFAWKDVGDSRETEKAMQIWLSTFNLQQAVKSTNP